MYRLLQTKVLIPFLCKLHWAEKSEFLSCADTGSQSTPAPSRILGNDHKSGASKLPSIPADLEISALSRKSTKHLKSIFSEYSKGSVANSSTKMVSQVAFMLY